MKSAFLDTYKNSCGEKFFPRGWKNFREGIFWQDSWILEKKEIYIPGVRKNFIDDFRNISKEKMFSFIF